MPKRVLIYFLLSVIPLISVAQTKHTLSGTVKDAKNGEMLIGVSVVVKELKTGVATNTYGYYSINLPQGTYSIVFSYIGYKTIEKTINLNTDNVKLNMELEEDKTELKEVLIKDNKPTAANVEANKMSVVKMDIKQVRKIPLLLGEVDVIKAVQLLSLIHI